MLKLSQIGDDALNAVCYIAQHMPHRVRIQDIALKHNMSISLLRLIVADLARGGIIQSYRWKNGWVTLAKSPEKITVFDILSVVWEELHMTSCTRGDVCNQQTFCYSNKLVWNLERGMHSLLKMQTIDKIIKQ